MGPYASMQVKWFSISLKSKTEVVVDCNTPSECVK